MKKPSVTTPIIIIVIGIIWFLNSAGLLPATNTMIAGALIITGFCILIFDGVNKSSIFSGPLLVYTGAAIYIKSHYAVPLSPILALGLVFLGLLMLISRMDAIPSKRFKQNLKNNPSNPSSHNSNTQDH